MGTLRLADAHYRLGQHDSFAFFSRAKLNWKERLERSINVETPSFIEGVAQGTLPSVVWIGPNFSNFNPIGFQPNDAACFGSLNEWPGVEVASSRQLSPLRARIAAW